MSEPLREEGDARQQAAGMSADSLQEIRARAERVLASTTEPHPHATMARDVVALADIVVARSLDGAKEGTLVRDMRSGEMFRLVRESLVEGSLDPALLLVRVQEERMDDEEFAEFADRVTAHCVGLCWPDDTPEAQAADYALQALIVARESRRRVQEAERALREGVENFSALARDLRRDSRTQDAASACDVFVALMRSALAPGVSRGSREQDDLERALRAAKTVHVLAVHGGWVLADDHTLGLVNEPAVAELGEALARLGGGTQQQGGG